MGDIGDSAKACCVLIGGMVLAGFVLVGIPILVHELTGYNRLYVFLFIVAGLVWTALFVGGIWCCANRTCPCQKRHYRLASSYN